MITDRLGYRCGFHGYVTKFVIDFFPQLYLLDFCSYAETVAKNMFVKVTAEKFSKIPRKIPVA